MHDRGSTGDERVRKEAHAFAWVGDARGARTSGRRVGACGARAGGEGVRRASAVATGRAGTARVPAGLATDYLTAFEQSFPRPERISGDHTPRRAASDEPYREVIYVDEMWTVGGIPGWLFSFSLGIAVLAIKAVAVGIVLRRNARRQLPPVPPGAYPPGVFAPPGTYPPGGPVPPGGVVAPGAIMAPGHSGAPGSAVPGGAVAPGGAVPPAAPMPPAAGKTDSVD